MFDLKENHRLSKDEISDLNKQGYSLDENKLYVLKFGFNDKLNRATDPRPFRVKTELVKKLADDGIGMPYIWVPENSEFHLRSKKDPNDAEGLLKLQTSYTIGTNAAHIITPSNNVYYLVEIWPEFENVVTKDELPPFTSPTLNILKRDDDWNIEDAQLLNIQAVNTPGYTKALAGITGVCKGGIKQCMNELTILAASGSLNATRKNPESFSILQNKIHSSMSADQGKATPSLETVVKDVEGIKSELSSVRSDLGAFGTKLDAIAQKIGAGDKPKDESVAGATGTDKDNKNGTVSIPKEFENHEFVKKLVAEHQETVKSLEQIKQEREAEKQKIAAQTRRAQATSIVERLIKSKQVKSEDKEKEIEKYFNLQNEDKTPKDLEVLDNYLKSTVSTENREEQIAGASGYEAPELKGDDSYTGKISNSDAFELISGGPNTI